jgi:S1-C subfamily serine protease
MADVLREISERLAGVVEAASRSVVRVEGRRGAPASGVAFAEDVVVTAHHVLEWDEDLAVGLPDGGTAEAHVVGRDPGTDLAALRVKGPALAPPAWSDPVGTRVGHLVLALSRPGSRLRAGLGIVSSKGGAWRTHTGGRLDHDLRVDLPLHPGFSGGLTVDAEGHALGLNTAGLARGVGVVVPSATLQRVVGALLAHGHVRRGFLGVGLQPVPLPSSLEAVAGQPAGLVVVGVEPGGPAERAGIVLGDVLIALDGHALRHPGDLLPLLEEERIGAEGVLRLLRGGESRELRVTIGVRSGGEKR